MLVRNQLGSNGDLMHAPNPRFRGFVLVWFSTSIAVTNNRNQQRALEKGKKLCRASPGCTAGWSAAARNAGLSYLELKTILLAAPLIVFARRAGFS